MPYAIRYPDTNHPLGRLRLPLERYEYSEARGCRTVGEIEVVRIVRSGAAAPVARSLLSRHPLVGHKFRRRMKLSRGSKVKRNPLRAAFVGHCGVVS